MPLASCKPPPINRTATENKSQSCINALSANLRDATGILIKEKGAHKTENEPKIIFKIPKILIADGGLVGTGDGAGLNPGVENDGPNSGRFPRVVHSCVPSRRARVWALTRPSVIQRRISSAVMGPYSFSSDPIILYILTRLQTVPPSPYTAVIR